MRIITRFEDIPDIVKKIGKIKGVKAIYLLGKSLYIIGEINEKEKMKIKGFATDKLNISFFDDLPIYTIFKIMRKGKPLIIKDLDYHYELCRKISWEYEDFRYRLKKFIQLGYKLRNGFLVKEK